MDRPDGLTDKQWVFCLEYVKDFNASAAARRAGYPAKSSAEIGYENLRKPHIKIVIDQVIEQSAMEAQEVLAHLASIARGDWGQYIGVKGQIKVGSLVRDGRANLVQKITAGQYGDSYHFPDRIAALKLIGQHVNGGMWTSRADVTSDGDKIETPTTVFYLPEVGGGDS